MTVVPHAEPVDDIAKVAMEFGVFVVRDADGEVVGIDNITGLQSLTKRQAVNLGDTGGIERLREILETKTGANDVLVAEHREPRRSLRQRVGDAVRVVKAWASRAVRAVREAVAWLSAPAGVVATYVRNRREPGGYTGRHRTQAAWYGAQRSTASRVAIERRRLSGRRPDDSEPALPENFVSYLALCVEAMRGHEDALHPRAGYQFRC